METLEQKLQVKEQEVADIRQQIKDRNEVNKPKDVTDAFKTFDDCCKSPYMTQRDLVFLDFQEKLQRDELAFFRKKVIAKALNEGYRFKSIDKRWYVWYDVSSGFVFHTTTYDDSFANTSSASRLCFKKKELAEHYVKYFKDEDETFIDLAD